MEIEIDLKINGAKIQLTYEQLDSLKDWIMGTVFSSKKQRKQRSVPISWTQIEIDFIKDQRKHKVSFSKIAELMKEKFGVDYSDQTIYKGFLKFKQSGVKEKTA